MQRTGGGADVKGLNQKFDLLKRHVDDVEDRVDTMTNNIDEGFYSVNEELDRINSKINEHMGHQECKNNSSKPKKRYR